MDDKAWEERNARLLRLQKHELAWGEFIVVWLKAGGRIDEAMETEWKKAREAPQAARDEEIDAESRALADALRRECEALGPSERLAVVERLHREAGFGEVAPLLRDNLEWVDEELRHCERLIYIGRLTRENAEWGRRIERLES